MTDQSFDLMVIGAGSGGVRAARMAAAQGARVAIVEESRVGGTCVMRGCVPKKLLMHGSHFAHELCAAEGYGWTIEASKHDWAAMIAQKNRELDRLEGIYQNLLDGSKVTVLDGRGTVTGPNTVTVNGTAYAAETILVATGSWPQVPDIPGAAYMITSNEALELDHRPQRVVIIGGGYIALEFAGIFNALGSAVTVVIRGEQVLRGFDQDVRDWVTAELLRKGVTIRAGAAPASVSRKDGGYTLALEDGGTVDADVVMAATGRVPNTKGLGLDAVGVTLTGNGAVHVDEHLRTNVPSIYALGDVIDRAPLTPVAIAEAMAFVDTVYRGQPRSMNYDAIPMAVFCQPPVGSVGLTQAAAVKRGPVDIYKASFRPLKYTLTKDEERSHMKMIVDSASQVVLGLHMVGADAAEIIQGFGVAVKAGLTKRDFDATVAIHPTAAEEFVTMRTPSATNVTA